MPTPETHHSIPDGLVRLRMHVNLAVQFGLLFAVVLGLAQTLFFTSATDLPGRIVDGERSALGGLLAGVAVSLIVGFQQWRAAAAIRDRRVAADPTASTTVDPGVSAEQTVRVPLTRAEVLRRADEVAGALDKARVTKVDESAGTITLTTGSSGWSWGETVVLTVGADDGGGTPVTVASKPRRWAPSDGGTNARNVERLADWLRGLAA